MVNPSGRFPPVPHKPYQTAMTNDTSSDNPFALRILLRVIRQVTTSATGMRGFPVTTYLCTPVTLLITSGHFSAARPVVVRCCTTTPEETPEMETTRTRIWKLVHRKKKCIRFCGASVDDEGWRIQHRRIINLPCCLAAVVELWGATIIYVDINPTHCHCRRLILNRAVSVVGKVVKKLKKWDRLKES